MIKTIALVVLVVLGALLIYAATRPDMLHVQRTQLINASPEKIGPLINDMHAFNTWNPYNRKDPQMKGSYHGPNAGPGAAFDFSGDKNVGAGRISIVEPRAPHTVSMKLDMTEPMAASNEIDFRLAPQGAATEVTWSMRGHTPYIGKLMGIFFNMDKMIGTDFENGLASLKALAEKP